MKIKAFVDWFQTKQGNNPFDFIPKKVGIYKIYVADEDKNKIKFGNDKKLAKPMRNSKTLQDIYESNLKCESTDRHILYIGKANNLRSRIKQYVRTVFGGKNHLGGIDIWSIQCYEELLNIEWTELPDNSFETSRDWEKREIANFKQAHNGNRPVANRVD